MIWLLPHRDISMRELEQCVTRKQYMLVIVISQSLCLFISPHLSPYPYFHFPLCTAPSISCRPVRCLPGLLSFPLPLCLQALTAFVFQPSSRNNFSQFLAVLRVRGRTSHRCLLSLQPDLPTPHPRGLPLIHPRQV